MNQRSFSTRDTCRVCHSKQLEIVLNYGEMPLAGGFFPADDERSRRRFPLHLMRCKDCTLMQVAETVNPDAIFGTYSYTSSVNRTLVAHNTELAVTLRQMVGDNGLIVEFGCNDGVLLNPLVKLGARVVGVDPSDVAERASAEHGWPLVRGYFGNEVAARIRSRFGEAKIIVANNVCAHVDDPNVLISGVTELLAADGRFVFEVHYQGDLVATRQYDTVYHEHTCYYSLASLQRLLSAHNLHVVDVTRIPIHCGSIRVTAARVGSGLEPLSSVETMIAEEARLDVEGFGKFAKRHRKTLHDLIGNIRQAGKRVVAYGASGRATILLNFCALGPEMLDHVSDLSPLRYNRVVPGVCVPILPRAKFHENYPNYALITAWNYETEIMVDERLFIEKGNAFIVPLPDIRVI